MRLLCVLTLIAFTCDTWVSTSAPSRSGRDRFRRLRISHRNSEGGKVKVLS